MKNYATFGLLGAVVLLLLAGGMLPAAEIAPSAPHSSLSLGAGLGIPFGVIGLNGEINPALPGSEALADHFGICAGIGYCVYGLGFSGGVHVYPWGRQRTFVPKLAVYMGTIGAIDWYGEHDILYGGAVGGGFLWHLGSRYALDCEALFLPFAFGWHISHLDAGRIKVSIGCRYYL